MPSSALQKVSTSKASAGSTTRTKAADLERIRNNQRRCRARQKERLAELEDKIRQYESATTQSSTDLKIKQLARENESLRRLLQSLGLGNDFLTAYTKASQIAPDISQTQLGIKSCCQGSGCSSSSLPLGVLQHGLTPTVPGGLHMENAPISSSPDTEVQNQEALQFLENLTEVDANLSWEPFDFPDTSNSTLESFQTYNQAENVVKWTEDTIMAEPCGNTPPEEDIAETTTLCSLAFSIILKNNLKGYSATDLDLKLRVGYRYGAALSDGCRVDNKILINVLAEIS